MSESQFGKGLQGMIPIVARVYRVQIPFWQEFTGYKFHFGKGVQEYESNFGKGLNGMNLFLARAYKGYQYRTNAILTKVHRVQIPLV